MDTKCSVPIVSKLRFGWVWLGVAKLGKVMRDIVLSGFAWWSSARFRKARNIDL